MAINGARIQRLTKEGLFYLDDEGEEVFIDFEECYELFFTKTMRRLHLEKSQEQDSERIELRDKTIQRYIKYKTTYTYVADSSLVGFTSSGLSGIRFYTDPPMLIEFETEEELVALNL